MSDKIPLLIVEDEQIERDLLKKLAERRGFVVKTAGTEAQAMRIIDEGFNPETAIVDFKIPEGRLTKSFDSQIYGITGGLRLCKFILESTNRTCRIVLSTGLDKYRAAAGEGGIWGYYSKPMSDVDVFFAMLSEGALKSPEIGQPTIDIKSEINKRLPGKER